VVDSHNYYFVASDGRRGDITRCHTFQPEIEDPEDYYYYLWTEAIQGYFVLRQHFLEGKPQQWFLRAEVETEERGPWVFDEVTEEIKSLLESGDQL